jgi:hypothetical protein
LAALRADRASVREKTCWHKRNCTSIRRRLSLFYIQKQLDKSEMYEQGVDKSDGMADYLSLAEIVIVEENFDKRDQKKHR